MKTRILLADDHEVVRDGLRSLLEKQPDFEVTGVTGDGHEAIAMAKRMQPNVIVMDISMPNLGGVEATRQIKASCPTVKILTLSVHSQGAIVAQMLRAGASGYVPKSCPAEELIEAIQTVTRGRTYISPEVMDSVTEYLGAEPEETGTQSHSLTQREREVLTLIASGKTTKQMADGLSLSQRTIEFHRHNIMDKLGIHSIAELTKYAVREGLTPLSDV